MNRFYPPKNIYLEILIDLGVFFATILLAAEQDWQTRDLVWSLWISSLLLGYLHIILAIAGTINQSSTTIPGLLGELFIIGGGLFTLSFFTFHFGFFHLIHAVFLDGFFPLFQTRGPEMALSVNTVLSFLGELIRNYWPFVAFSALSRGTTYVNAYHTIDRNAVMLAPYGSVVRMHLMILLLGFLSATTNIQGYALYIVLVFYFFPFKLLWEKLWVRESD
ncbi:MAG: hypothetical protein ISR59_11700 [Anaerolineales bacterium]|uniref:Uncharacterized protein n=1 Tax=Candidatus Desulfolinea nitratireducens TaxID=2841698 RepID=A0A8J6TI69_9CHLR|nr:hypothetical protein [Candidatus Desulfolinea nitratireducens]MBL6961764.1 hypothetical protein [Anaerolineales bacterium]